MATQLGRIAALSQRVKPEISPLQRQVNRVAWLIAAIAVAAGGMFFIAGTTLAGLSLAAAVTFAIGLLVANVPEGLLPTITLSLAGGVRRMAARRALVKRLTAVETLGSTDVICTDKTGTLTEGSMSVQLLWCAGSELPLTAADGHAPELFAALLRTAVRCNNARIERQEGRWVRSGDPTESALLLAAAQLGVDIDTAERERDQRRKLVFHFDPHLKRMTTLDEEPGRQLWYHAKGAPLELLDRCSAVRISDGDRPLTESDRIEVRTAFERYAARGLRVLGFAQRHVAQFQDGTRELVESELTFVGLAALEDPPRPEVTDAVARCRHAGIRIIVVTGDHALTAGAIAREVGIAGDEPTLVAGTELDAMPQDERDRLLRDTPELIVARSNPETKLHIVDALRAQHHTVAMTGDGVNDAPALRRADIGVAMGRSGTDVAREAATMVLTDDNFASIVAAVEEGRVVYDNIRKFITYIFVHAIPEIVPFLVYALAGGAIPLPLTALQILAIDLGTDTVPALALGREPAEPGTMDRDPRPREAGIISRAMLTRAWLRLGALEALLVMGGFFLVLLTAGWAPGDATGPGMALHDAYLQATTMTWAGIVACQMGAAFAVRTSHASLRQVGVLSNRYLLRGVAFAIAFATAIIYVPPLQSVFQTAALPAPDLLVLACFPFIVWGSDELWRWRRRKHQTSLASTSSREAKRPCVDSKFEDVTPSTSELVTLGAPIALRDGSHVRIRQGHRSDRDLLRRGFERLSPESRYRRFLAPMQELTESTVRYLTEIDHQHHEAMIALDDQTGEGIGVARYVRDPDHPDVAEVAVTVIDDWQGRGLGTLLLEVISARARQEGITRFTALMLATNQEMMDLLQALDPVRIVDRELGTVEIEVPIPAIGLAPALREVIRIAAQHDIAIPLARHDGPRRIAGDD
jgi:magnesium-transporting ATPase (P-type)/GNAT superfamily N-acetyltransferase